MREAVTDIANRAQPGAHVASESPSLASHYAQQVGRPDLVCVSLSDPAAVNQLRPGDYIIVARGRRYFSNDALITTLRTNATPTAELSLGTVPSVKIYQLDENSLRLIQQTN